MAGAASSPESKLYGGMRRGAIGRRYSTSETTSEGDFRPYLMENYPEMELFERLVGTRL